MIFEAYYARSSSVVFPVVCSSYFAYQNPGMGRQTNDVIFDISLERQDVVTAL
jgi:hypothetical protein